MNTTPVLDDEPFESYLRHNTADGHSRLSTFRKIESDKAVTREFQKVFLEKLPKNGQASLWRKYWIGNSRQFIKV
jgi:hypothetical protein